jgi:hypothetical protein
VAKESSPYCYLGRFVNRILWRKFHIQKQRNGKTQRYRIGNTIRITYPYPVTSSFFNYFSLSEIFVAKIEISSKSARLPAKNNIPEGQY